MRPTISKESIGYDLAVTPKIKQAPWRRLFLTKNVLKIWSLNASAHLDSQIMLP